MKQGGEEEQVSELSVSSRRRRVGELTAPVSAEARLVVQVSQQPAMSCVRAEQAQVE